MDVLKLRSGISFFAFQALLLLVFLIPTITFFARQSPPALIGVAAALAVLSRYFSPEWGPYVLRLTSIVKSQGGIFFAAFCAFACLSVLWSSAGLKGFIALAQTMSGVVTTVLVLAAFEKSDVALLSKVFLAGLTLGAILLIADNLNAHALRYIFSSHGNSYDSNRSSVLVALGAPILLGMIFKKNQMALIASGILLLMLFAVALSSSESAKLSFLCSTIAFLLLYFGMTRMWIVFVSFIALLFMAAPIIYGFVHDLMPEVIFKTTSYQTVEIRAKIWAVYASLVSLKPLIGFGVGASETAYLLPIVESKVGVKNTFLQNIHPHGAPLQIWFELGLLGAGLTTATFVTAVKGVQKYDRHQMSVVGSFIIGAVAVSSVSHGLWQAWWPCVIGYAAIGIFSSHHRPA